MTNWNEAQHPRDDRGKFEEAGTPLGDRRVPASQSAAAAPHVSSVAPGDRAADGEEWWAEDGLPPPGEFWDEDDASEDGTHLHPDWAALPGDPR